jgi:hypothetical protein
MTLVTIALAMLLGWEAWRANVETPWTRDAKVPDIHDAYHHHRFALIVSAPLG